MTQPRILLKLPNWIGDCVMATPAIRYLRTAFPDAQLDALVRPGIAPAIVSNPHLSEVLAVDSREATAAFVDKLKQTRYDAIVLFTNSLSSGWFAFRLGIPRRIGYARAGRSPLLTHRVKFDKREWRTPTPAPLSRKSIRGPHDAPPMPHHTVNYYLRLAQVTASAFGVAEPQFTEPLRMELVPRPAALQHVDEVIKESGLSGKKLVGLNPGAAYGSAKRYPHDQLAGVLDQLNAPDIAFVSTAPAPESTLTDLVQDKTAVPLHRLGENFDLHGGIALISRLSVYITNDSGPMHIAAALGVPTVALFGPTDWNVTSPYSTNAIIVRRSPACAPCFLRECPIDHRCMRDIPPEEIAQGARQLLDRAQP